MRESRIKVSPQFQPNLFPDHFGAHLAVVTLIWAMGCQEGAGIVAVKAEAQKRQPFSSVFTDGHGLDTWCLFCILGEKGASAWPWPLVEPLEKQLLFILFPTMMFHFWHSKIYVCPLTTYVPGHRTLGSACGLRALLMYWHLSEDQICSRPRASWCWDKTPGFHLSTMGGGGERRWKINKVLASIKWKTRSPLAGVGNGTQKGHLKEIVTSDAEANLHLSST